MDGEPEALSDTATNCNLASASETLSDNNQAKLDSLEKKAVHLRLYYLFIWYTSLNYRRTLYLTLFLIGLTITLIK